MRASISIQTALCSVLVILHIKDCVSTNSNSKISANTPITRQLASTQNGHAEVTYGLYDLSTDPFEDYNVHSLEGYKSIVDGFESKREYWQSLTMPPNVPDESLRDAAWSACGRVCPWTVKEASKPKEIEQKYSNPSAPHIVYILIDDWGYNDFGKRSNYLSWTTPTLDSLASEGVLLENYYTNDHCAPSRASLLTGRYALRTGVYFNYAELPSNEVTLAQELKSAGYRNYIIGKWHLGQSDKSLYPTQRGFDYFYGFMNSAETYYSKKHDGYIDLFENEDLVTDSKDLDESYHSAYLYQSKAEHVIQSHAKDHPSTPMFLYYSMQLVHSPWTAPQRYLSRCDRNRDYFFPDDSHYHAEYAVYNYCGLNLLMDESIANITCALSASGMADNTVIIIAGDNGQSKEITGANYPYKGYKESAMQGAFATTAIIHSPLLPENVRGSSYSHPVHITDWLPTIMGLATNGEWTGSYSGADIDGVDIWPGISTNTPSPRTEIVFTSYQDGTFVMLSGNMKFIYNSEILDGSTPDVTFERDLDPKKASTMCVAPSLIEKTYSQLLMRAAGFSPSSSSSHFRTVDIAFTFFSIVALLIATVVGLVLYASSSQIQANWRMKAEMEERVMRRAKGLAPERVGQSYGALPREVDPLL